MEKFIKDLNLKPLPNTISEVAIKNYIQPFVGGTLKINLLIISELSRYRVKVK
ncbi:hypothetical protein EMGBS15_17380 [Filimonas sp.]|nr:hypothetical protein EMGBS15_17380 [Filimonas sp.]